MPSDKGIFANYDYRKFLDEWTDKDAHNDWQIYPAPAMTSGRKYVVCKLTWRGKEGTYNVTHQALSIEEAVYGVSVEMEKFNAKRP